MSGSTNQLAEARARRALQAMRLPVGRLERASSTHNEIHLTECHVVRVSTQLNQRLYREALLYEHLPEEPWAPALVGVGSRSGTDFVIVERKPGQPLAHAWPFLSVDARRRAIAELAACMRTIHATPTPDPSAVPPLQESLYLLGPVERRAPEPPPALAHASTASAPGSESDRAPTSPAGVEADPVRTSPAGSELDPARTTPSLETETETSTAPPPIAGGGPGAPSRTVPSSEPNQAPTTPSPETETSAAPPPSAVGPEVPVPAALLPRAATRPPSGPSTESRSAEGPATATGGDAGGDGVPETTVDQRSAGAQPTAEAGAEQPRRPVRQPAAEEVAAPLIAGLQRLADDANADPGVISTALDYVRANAHHLAPHDRSHLVHGDLTFENVLHHQDGVSAIVDYEWCRGGPADLDLDVLLRCCAMPGRHVAPRFEALTRPEDYEPVPEWLADAYPELFATAGLTERLTLYAMAFDVRDALAAPLPRHRADVDDDHPYNRLIGLVSTGGHVAMFLTRIGLPV